MFFPLSVSLICLLSCLLPCFFFLSFLNVFITCYFFLHLYLCLALDFVTFLSFVSLFPCLFFFLEGNYKITYPKFFFYYKFHVFFLHCNIQLKKEIQPRHGNECCFFLKFTSILSVTETFLEYPNDRVWDEVSY